MSLRSQVKQEAILEYFEGLDEYSVLMSDQTVKRRSSVFVDRVLLDNWHAAEEVEPKKQESSKAKKRTAKAKD